MFALIHVVKENPVLLKKVIERGYANSKFNPLVCESEVTRENLFDETILILESLYWKEDILYIGHDRGTELRTAETILNGCREIKKQVMDIDDADFEVRLKEFGRLIPKIIPNPLCGHKVESKSGTMSQRCDRAVSEFKVMGCEFDSIPKQDQWAFWHGIGLPIYALIDSGGKSIHAWIKVDGIETLEQWEAQIEQDIYPLLCAYGIDSACKNASRLSRLPGIMRVETGQKQTLLYFNQNGDIL